jgi:hypothetical protein
MFDSVVFNPAKSEEPALIVSSGPGIRVFDPAMSLTGPVCSHHTFYVTADPSQLSPNDAALTIEASLFYELDNQFGTEVARDVLSGFKVSDDIAEAVTSVVQQHINPDMIDVSDNLLGVFGSSEREFAAAHLISTTQTLGEDWQAIRVSEHGVARFLNGTPYKPYMPAGNSFVHDKTPDSELDSGFRTVEPDYRLIVRAWKGAFV